MRPLKNSNVCFKGKIEINTHKGSVPKKNNFRIAQSHLWFILDQIDHIIELVSKWFPDGKFFKIDTTLRTESTYEKEIMYDVLMKSDTLQKSEHEYHGKLCHTIRHI